MSVGSTYYFLSYLQLSPESVPQAGAAIVKKAWSERLNDEPELESDADEQLLMHIP